MVITKENFIEIIEKTIDEIYDFQIDLYEELLEQLEERNINLEEEETKQVKQWEERCFTESAQLFNLKENFDKDKRPSLQHWFNRINNEFERPEDFCNHTYFFLKEARESFVKLKEKYKDLLKPLTKEERKKIIERNKEKTLQTIRNYQIKASDLCELLKEKKQKRLQLNKKESENLDYLIKKLEKHFIEEEEQLLKEYTDISWELETDDEIKGYSIGFYCKERNIENNCSFYIKNLLEEIENKYKITANRNDLEEKLKFIIIELATKMEKELGYLEDSNPSRIFKRSNDSDKFWRKDLDSFLFFLNKTKKSKKLNEKKLEELFNAILIRDLSAQILEKNLEKGLIEKKDLKTKIEEKLSTISLETYFQEFEQKILNLINETDK